MRQGSQRQSQEHSAAESPERNGHCLCGKIQYIIKGDCLMSALCHCPSCRRGAGAPMVAWAMFELSDVALTKGSPRIFESSPGARRHFCGECGTSLFYEADFIPGLIDVAVASFEEPDALPPQMHIWESHRLEWLQTRDALPRFDGLPPTE